MRIPLSISPNYVNWSWWQSIRELFQNGMDAHESGHELRFGYVPAQERLYIQNSGASLQRESLVLGVTSKKGDLSKRGEFGEGYKLAVATLLRLGAKVQILNGEEIWVPELSHSSEFNTEIVYFNIYNNPNGQQSLAFIVDGIPENEWLAAKASLLFLQKYPDSIKTSKGTLISAPEFAGKLFVKSIYVGDLPDKYQFGFDFPKIRLDRDRQAPDTISLRSGIIGIIQAALSEGKLTALQVLDLLESAGGESLAFDSDWAPKGTFHEAISDAFDQKYGNMAVPVASQEEGVRAGDFSMTGVLVNNSLLKVLRKVKSPLDKIISSKVFEVSKEYSASELEEHELNSLQWAFDLIAPHETVSMKDIHIVDFVGNRIWGKYSSGQISLARRILKDRVNLIATLVHEVCHRHGLDGSQAHRDMVEDRMGKIIVSLHSSVCAPVIK